MLPYTCCPVAARPSFSPQVLLLSARDTLLARLMLSGKADAATQQRFLRLAFGMFSSGRRAPGPQQVTAAAQELLAESGVLQLEERVLGFLFSHAAVVKLLATVDDLQRLIGQVGGSGASTVVQTFVAGAAETRACTWCKGVWTGLLAGVGWLASADGFACNRYNASWFRVCPKVCSWVHCTPVICYLCKERRQPWAHVYKHPVTAYSFIC